MLPTVNGEFVIVADPEMRFSTDGKPWAKVRAVAKDRRKNANGEWEDGDTCFIDIIVGGKTAEYLVESAGKGDSIVVQGKLNYRQWESDDGRKNQSYSIRADNIGVSVKFGTAKTSKAIAFNSGLTGEMIKQNASPTPADDEAPF